jgi:integrase
MKHRSQGTATNRSMAVISDRTVVGFRSNEDCITSAIFTCSNSLTSTYLSPQDGTRLLAAVASSPYANAFAVMLFCGLRVNECLALRWADVDLERATLRVEHSLTHTGQGKRQLGDTKTERSRRSMDLPAVAVKALKAQRKQQMAEQARAGSQGFAWCDDEGLIFTAVNGIPASDSSVRKDFARCLRAAGLSPMRLHDLRHSCATILLAAGLPVNVVSEIMGHSSAAITWSVYGHTLPATRRVAADAMDRALQS